MLAGPVTSAPAPFRIYRWKPQDPTYVRRPVLLHEWAYSWGTSTPGGRSGKPEGLSVLDRGRPGLLVLFDESEALTHRRLALFRRLGPHPRGRLARRAGREEQRSPPRGDHGEAPAKASRVALNKSAKAISHASARCRSHG